MQSASFYRRFGRLLFVVLAIIAPVIVWGARQAIQNNANKIEDWLPESFEETQQLRWFAGIFGGDDLIMISWEGCTLSDPRLTRYAAELRRPMEFENQQEVLPFRDVVTGAEALAQMTKPPLELSRPHALARLRGWALGNDGQTSCVLAKLTPEGWQERHAVADHLYQAADRVPGLAADELHVAGPVLDSVAIDQASNHRLMLMTNASFGLCFLLMCFLLRSVLLAMLVFFNAILCQQMSLALIYFSGTQMDSVLLIVPMLVYVLVVSAGVHLSNYYRDAVGRQGLDGAVGRAVSDAFAPCWLASLTTGLGLSSLLVSFLVPVRKFGTFACLAVLVGTGMLFLFLPALLERFPPRRARDRWPQAAGRPQDPWKWLLSVIRFLRYPILAAALLVLVAGVTGITKLQASARIHDMFRSNARVLQDYEWLQERIGPLVSFETVLRMPPLDEQSDDAMIERMMLVGYVHAAATSVEGMGAAVSAWNFCPSLRGTSGGGIRQIARRNLLNRKLLKSRHSLAEMALVRNAEGEQLWRVSGRAYAGMGLDFTRVMADLKAAVEPIVAAAHRRGIPVDVVYCGGVPLVEKAQNQMIQDLISSFLVAFAFIAGMMVLLMIGLSRNDLREVRSVRIRGAILVRAGAAGLIAMSPNILPCVAVMGAMGLLGQKLEIGSMMTASVALGIAVDDTVHFITWFRRALAAGDSRADAVRHAYQKSGPAMLQTTCICGFGLLVFSFSPFVPIARFAWVMFAMLGSAILADLVLLPAILLGPLGVVFERHPAIAGATVLAANSADGHVSPVSDDQRSGSPSESPAATSAFPDSQ